MGAVVTNEGCSKQYRENENSIFYFSSDMLKFDLGTNADSEGPDQTAHPRSLIWAFTVRLQNH